MLDGHVQLLWLVSIRLCEMVVAMLVVLLVNAAVVGCISIGVYRLNMQVCLNLSSMMWGQAARCHIIGLMMHSGVILAGNH